jgi:hypothetical protein
MADIDKKTYRFFEGHDGWTKRRNKRAMSLVEQIK